MAKESTYVLPQSFTRSKTVVHKLVLQPQNYCSSRSIFISFLSRSHYMIYGKVVDL